MTMLHLQDSSNRDMGVRHHVSQIIGCRSSDNNMVSPTQFSRLPLFSDPRLGGYPLELAGVYEVLSEYYRLINDPECMYHEAPYKRVYIYYVYEGGDAPLQEIRLGAVPSALESVPFCRAVVHLGGAS